MFSLGPRKYRGSIAPGRRTAVIVAGLPGLFGPDASSPLTWVTADFASLVMCARLLAGLWSAAEQALLSRVSG